jgi:muramoyltetrapeptide carboxypeptidase LdcA involved in peptidoglycan recycling
MPPLEGSVLFLEDDELTFPENFDRDLQSLIHQPGFNHVSGLVIGRFQKVSKVTPSLLGQIIQSKKELKSLPVIANVDFGHTDPKLTLPIGGEVKVEVKGEDSSIVITRH